VVADQRAPRDGDFVEIVGHYNPRSEEKELVLKEERVRHWLDQGARPSETVHRLLHKQGLIAEAPRQRISKPSRADREAAATAAAAAEEQAAAEAATAAAAAATADAPANGAAEADDAGSDAAAPEAEE
jgi:small subunit ribosomal protein S16